MLVLAVLLHIDVPTVALVVCHLSDLLAVHSRLVTFSDGLKLGVARLLLVHLQLSLVIVSLLILNL